MTGLELGVMCLALNIFFEARNDPPQAQMAVALVTINRAKERNLSLCETVFQPYQFSWTHESQHKAPAQNNKAWLKAQAIAKQSLMEKDFTDGAMWYHRHDIKPYWAKNKQLVGRYGSHIFYRKKVN